MRVMVWWVLKAREGERKWANSEKTIANQRQRDLTWHELREQRQTKLFETQRQSIRGRMKERASLAGASGWLRLFNALINPLLKAKQRVSGFVLWPRDYSGINKGWAGNTDEIPPPPLCLALWLFSNQAGGRDDMQKEICQRETTHVRAGMLNERLKNTCMVQMSCMHGHQETQVTRWQAMCARLFIVWWPRRGGCTGCTEPGKSINPLRKFSRL